MKKLISSLVLCMVMCCIARAETVSNQILYWQITDADKESYGASIVNMYAIIDGSSEKIGNQFLEFSDFEKAESMNRTQTITVGAGGWTWPAEYDFSKVSFYAELLNDNGISVATSDVATYNAIRGFMDETFSGSTPSTKHDGYYTFSYSAIPEPTSGLLMLIGIAGLALRRRRA